MTEGEKEAAAIVAQQRAVIKTAEQASSSPRMAKGEPALACAPLARAEYDPRGGGGGAAEAEGGGGRAEEDRGQGACGAPGPAPRPPPCPLSAEGVAVPRP